MEYDQLIAKRYSVRAYRPDPIPAGMLTRVLEAACLAPTAANRQPFQIIVIKTKDKEDDLLRIYRRPWFVQAPLVLCAVGVPSESWVRSDDHRRYLDVDVAIVMDHLILAAANLGLGTCWIAAFNAREARRLLRLPDEVEPLIFTPLGFPADEPGPKERKPFEELVRYEMW